MFVRTRKRDSGKTQIQIIESVRVGATVKQKIIRNVALAANDKEIEQFTVIAEAAIVNILNSRQPVLPFLDPKEVHTPQKRSKNPDIVAIEDQVKVKNIRHESTVNDGWESVFGSVYDQIGFSSMLSTRKHQDQWNSLLRDLVIARIANPASKRLTQKSLEEEFNKPASLDSIYRLLDHVNDHEEVIKNKVLSSTRSLFREKIDVLFFDVTTLYFESILPDDLKKFGYSKDCKFGEVQVVLAMITTTDGLPVSYKLFAGNTSESKTLIECIEELSKEFDVGNVVLAADRAMFSDANLAKLEALKVNYVVAAKLKSLSKVMKDKILNDPNYGVVKRGNSSAWLNEFSLGTRRLIVTMDYGRAAKDEADRKRLIDRLIKKQRQGKIKVSDLISNHGTKRFIKINGGIAEVNLEKIEEAEKWDGLHGVITNDKLSSALTILERYHGLWQIEEAFRFNKHELKMRPIFHWTPKRIKAHVLLCFIAFATAKQTLARLKMKGISLSISELRRILSSVEQYRLQDISTKKSYLVPSRLSKEQAAIISALKIERATIPTNI